MTYIILDRDGVINFDSIDYIKSPEEWHAIPGSLEAIAKLNQAGFKVLVATNQSGIGRGYYSAETLTQIHEKLISELKALGGHIHDFFYCPHLPTDNCDCRKPKAGMLQQIKDKYRVDLTQTFFIGDSLTDIQAAQTVRSKPLLVLTGNGRKALENHEELKNIPSFHNLATAVEFILQEKNA